MSFDPITGQPIRSATDEQPRFWSDHPARQWHIDAAGRADQAARNEATIRQLERQLAAETDPMRRHGLEVRLAVLLGAPIPPPPAETKPDDGWKGEIAQIRQARGRKRDRVRAAVIRKET
jgi:hypothetical protein